MASLFKDSRKNQIVQFADKTGERRTVGIGQISDTGAERIKARIEKLNAASIAGVAIDENTAEWVAGLSDRLHAKLAKLGLIAERAKPASGKLTTLAGFIDGYIATRADVKQNTRDHLTRARGNLVDFFGKDKPIDKITRGDADEFRLHLRKTMADNTVRRICGRAKQFFRVAVRKELIAKSPFEDMKGTVVRENREREFFVSRDMATRVLDACPNNEWRLLFALSRYGGLRCPSEHLELCWGHVDWERNRIHVQSPKTEHHEGKEARWIPLFPELRPYLEAAFDEAKPGTEHVITRYRDANANLRTQLHRIIRKAGLDPWPKVFQNLRSTRETELMETFPSHVVCAWIGNSEAVARRHYLQVTDEHFAAGAGLESAASGAAHPNGIEGNDAEPRKGTRKNPRKNANSRCLSSNQAPPVGLEPTTSRLTAGCSTN